MDNSKYDEVIERLFYEQPEEVRNKKFSLYLLKPLPGLEDTYATLRYEGHWKMPSPSGKKAWEPAKWQGGTDHTAPLKHGKDPKAVAKRRKKKKLASKR